MKKLIFTLMMMAGLALVAGTAMGQDNMNPYQGGTYTYTMDGIDDVANTRTARVFIDADGQNDVSPDRAIDLDGGGTDDYTVTSTLTVTKDVSATPSYFDIAIPANTTSVSFDVFYEDMPTGAHELTMVVYDGTDADCYNFIYTGITVIANDFDLAMGADASDCQTINPNPAVDTPASSGQNTVFTYTVTKTGGAIDDDWGFDFDITTTGVTLDYNDITNISAAITTGTGTNSVNLTGTAASGDYAVKVTNDDATNDATEVTISVTVPTTTGSADAGFPGTVTAATLYNNNTTDVIINTETNGANNSQTITLETIPSIGTFQ
jgi:hypothetical protein